jgi:hypothetical protein
MNYKIRSTALAIFILICILYQAVAAAETCELDIGSSYILWGEDAPFYAHDNYDSDGTYFPNQVDGYDFNAGNIASPSSGFFLYNADPELNNYDILKLLSTGGSPVDYVQVSLIEAGVNPTDYSYIFIDARDSSAGAGNYFNGTLTGSVTNGYFQFNGGVLNVTAAPETPPSPEHPPSDVYWDKATSGAWTTASHWDPDYAPDDTIRAHVNNGSSADISAGMTAECRKLLIGEFPGNTGAVNMSGGALNVTENTVVGSLGTGTFTQADGNHSVTEDLHLGYMAGSNGTYTLGAGNLDARSEYVATSGVGLFTQNGGANTIGQYLYVGYNPGSDGTYELKPGAALQAQVEIIGHAGDAVFKQTGGANIISGTLAIGNNPGSNGLYELNGELEAAIEYVGRYGKGEIKQTSGTNNVVTNLYMGTFQGSEGIYNLNGGILAVGGEIENGSGTSTLNINNGTLNFTGITIDVDNFNIGNEAGQQGEFSLPEGRTLRIRENLVVGNEGDGSFLQGLSSHVTVDKKLIIGGSSTCNNALFSQAVGNLTELTVLQGIAVGTEGTNSIFTFAGGNAFVTGDMQLTDSLNFTNATFNQTGGTFNLNGSILDGQGTSKFNFSGGQLNFTTGITVDEANFLGGTFTIEANKSLDVNEEQNVKSGGKVLNSGGSNTTPLLDISAGGEYKITGSTLIADRLHVNGQYIQQNGSANSYIESIIGNTAGSSGVMNISGGSLEGYEIIVGNLGTGTLNVSGTGVVQFNNVDVRNGAINVAGGTVQAAVIDVGVLGEGSVTHTGGTVTVQYELNVGQWTSGADHTYTLKGANLSGSSATMNVTGSFGGYGTPHLSVVDNNGGVIANGYGQMRDLDLTQVDYIENSGGNPYGGRGWYAYSGGRLVMEGSSVSEYNSSGVWGDDYYQDLDNSVAYTFYGMTGYGNVEISLLAGDRSDVPAGIPMYENEELVSVWDISTDFSFDTVDLIFCHPGRLTYYNSVRLYHYDGGWTKVGEWNVDKVNGDYLLGANGLDSLSPFALVASDLYMDDDDPPNPIPEPATVVSITGGIVMVAYRRVLKRKK